MIVEPLITIGCLCYNTGEYVIEAIESIINSSYKNIELIVIDDYSSDFLSLKKLEDYLSGKLSIKFIKNDKNNGIISNLNTILYLAKGKYLAFISDDLITKNKLKLDIELFEKLDNEYILIHSIAQTIDGFSNIYNSFSPDVNNYKLFDDLILIEDMIENPFIHASTVMFKTEHVKSLGGWDNTLLFEDKPFWFKLSEKKFKIKFRAEVNSFYRKHNQNVSADYKYGFWIYQFQLYSRYSKFKVSRIKLNRLLKQAFGSIDYDECLKIYFNSYKPNYVFYYKWFIYNKIGVKYLYFIKKNIKLHLKKIIDDFNNYLF
uniref:glycosyltransferase family 2 protein n=1 Tax=Algoriphagus sp. TaxID=1872435 RepID=UPI0040475179